VNRGRRFTCKRGLFLVGIAHADAIKTFDLNSLPADVRAVLLGVRQRNVELKKSNAALSTQNAELEALNARLEHFVKELNQVIYGGRSEKLTEDER
jgi:transposase